MAKNSELKIHLKAQRYFHIIAFKADASYYSAESFWKDSKLKKSSSDLIFDLPKFKIEKSKIKSSIRYFNSLEDEDYSVNKDGNPPFHYDIFTIDSHERDLLIIAFPFKSLARNVIQNLIENKKLLTKGSFVKANLNKLIKTNHKTDFVYNFFTSHFSGVEFALPGDINVSTVNLDGDKPLESALYKNVFQKKIIEGECNLEKCSLKCETVINDIVEVPKTKSNIHMDIFGNYKIYIHGSGKNIVTIPFMFDLLKQHKCLDFTLINPINRSRE